MSLIFRLFWDLDDTLLATQRHLAFYLQKEFGVIVDPSVYLTDTNTQGCLQHVLTSAEFMTNTPVIPEMVDLFQYLKQKTAHRDDIVFHGITHRGYHPFAAQYTQPLLERVGLEFDHVHYLDPRVNANKVAWIRDQYDSPFVILDDRPFYDDVQAEIPGNVIVMDKPWNQSLPASTRCAGAEEALAAILSEVCL